MCGALFCDPAPLCAYSPVSSFQLVAARREEFLDAIVAERVGKLLDALASVVAGPPCGTFCAALTTVGAWARTLHANSRRLRPFSPSPPLHLDGEWMIPLVPVAAACAPPEGPAHYAACPEGLVFRSREEEACMLSSLCFVSGPVCAGCGRPAAFYASVVRGCRPVGAMQAAVCPVLPRGQLVTQVPASLSWSVSPGLDLPGCVSVSQRKRLLRSPPVMPTDRGERLVPPADPDSELAPSTILEVGTQLVVAP